MLSADSRCLVIILGVPGSILNVESCQNVESKTKNVESKIEKYVVQNSICILQEIRYFWALTHLIQIQYKS